LIDSTIIFEIMIMQK